MTATSEPSLTPSVPPALDEQGLRQAIRRLPGVRDAEVRIRRFWTPPGAAPPTVPQITPQAGPRTGAASAGMPATGVAGRPSPADPAAPLSLVHGPAVRPTAGAAQTLQQALLSAADGAGDRGTTYLLADGTSDRQTYAQLLADARRALGGLRRAGLSAGDTVLLQCGDNRAFVTAFWACVIGGFLPTPVGPAPSYSSQNAVTRKLRAAWELLGHPLIVTDDDLAEPVRDLAARWQVPAVRAASVTDLSAGAPGAIRRAEPSDPVLNLLTSGSTGVPKCVSHRNSSIVARTWAAIEANGFTSADVSLNWMPLDHVGGIVMFNVRDVFLSCEHVNARTGSFIQRPLAWLDWIQEHGATNTWAPNFAFAQVVDQAAAIESGQWDLSSMRNICNAGEAVVHATAHRFLELLEPHGLGADVMIPCWGMSETSSGVTYSRLRRHQPETGSVTVRLDSLTGQIAVRPYGTPGTMTLTEVGTPIGRVSLRITGDDGNPVPEGQVGRLHVTGATMLAEYHRNPEANQKAFQPDGWFDTGDLGFLRDGKLFLTGRGAEMVVINGANYPVHELEAVAGQVPGVLATYVAVGAVPDPAGGTDLLTVFFTPATADGDVAGPAAGIRSAMSRQTGLAVRQLVPVPRDQFPKTASGKIQRNELLAALQTGRLTPLSAAGADRPPDPDDRLAVLERVFQEIAMPRGGGRPARVLVLADSGDELPDDLRALGMPVTVIRSGPVLRLASDGATADPDVPWHLDSALDHLLGPEPPEYTVYAWGRARLAGDAEPGTAPDAVCRPSTRLMSALRALAAHADRAGSGRDDAVPGRAGRILVLTGFAVSVLPGETPDIGNAALTGLVRTAAVEGCADRVTLLDAPADAAAADIAAALTADLRTGEIIALRAGRWHAQRLRVADLADRLTVPASVLPAGGLAVLIGGLGGLGAEVARYLAVAAGACVVLIGRTPEDELEDSRVSLLDELRELGDVHYRAADVTDAAALNRAVAEFEADRGRPVDCVMHLAALDIRRQWADLEAHEIRKESPGWLREVMAPKALGALAVANLLATRPASHTVLFSSVNGILGGASYGAYAAASASLDGFGQWLAAAGRPVHCVAWSMWHERGMNEGSPLVPAARRRGMRVIRPADGIATLLACLNDDRGYLAVGLDPASAAISGWLADDQLGGAEIVVVAEPADPLAGDEVSALIENAVRGLAPGTAADVRVMVVDRVPRGPDGAFRDIPALYADPIHASSSYAAQSYAEPEGERETAAAAVLAEVMNTERWGRFDSFFEMGGDSVRALRAAGRLSTALGQPVPVSLLYDHPTVRDLVTALSVRV